MNRSLQTRRNALIQLSTCLLFAGGTSIGCSSTSTPPTAGTNAAYGILSLSAAASLQSVLKTLLDEFESTQSIQPSKLVFGASGSLFAQIIAGAPHDIFFSADTTYPQKLIEVGLADTSDYFPLAKGRLVLWVAKHSTLFETISRIDSQSLEQIIKQPNSRVAIANPRLAPYGQAAIKTLESLSLFQALENHLVYGENVAQTAQLAHSGAADAAFIALSQALSPPMSDAGDYWLIPSEHHKPLEQAAVILKHTIARDAAVSFRDFILSAAVDDIWKKFGYELLDR